MTAGGAGAISAYNRLHAWRRHLAGECVAATRVAHAPTSAACAEAAAIAVAEECAAVMVVAHREVAMAAHAAAAAERWFRLRFGVVQVH